MKNEPVSAINSTQQAAPLTLTLTISTQTIKEYKTLLESSITMKQYSIFNNKGPKTEQTYWLPQQQSIGHVLDPC
jgi:hypothetical protein